VANDYFGKRFQFDGVGGQIDFGFRTLIRHFVHRRLALILTFSPRRRDSVRRLLQKLRVTGFDGSEMTGRRRSAVPTALAGWKSWYPQSRVGRLKPGLRTGVGLDGGARPWL